MKISKTKNLLYSTIINILFLVIAFTLFEPTTKSDDYDMANLLYGGISGEYSPFLMYSHYWYGKILVFLLQCFPSVSWFWAMQYILMITANILIGSIFIKNKKRGMLFFSLYLICFSYEFYVRITFSKTAGFIMFAGFFLILCYIEKKASYVVALLGAFYIFMGMLIRPLFYKMILVIMLPTFLIYLVTAKKEDLKKGIFCFVGVVIVGYLVCGQLTSYNTKVYENNPSWSTFMEDNSTRASLIDLGIPSYAEHEEEYKDMGISENDYTFWFTYAYRSDVERLNNDLYRGIVNLRTTTKSENGIILISATHKMLQYLTSNIVAVFFIMLLAIMVLSKSEKVFLKLSLIVLFSMIPYFYLSWLGRLQHHVDAVIFIGASILTMYYTETNNWNKKNEIIFVTMLGIVLGVFFDGLSSSSYYGTSYGNIASEKEQRESNYEKLKRLSQDKDHLYVMAPLDTNTIYPCFSIDRVFEKSFYSNIVLANAHQVPDVGRVIQNYGIKNIWKECTDSEVIRLVFSDLTNRQVECVQTYIRENYNSNAVIQLEDEYEGVYVYSVVSE